MNKADDPQYYMHLCNVIRAVFTAEHTLLEKENLVEQLKSKKITSQEYIEKIADELLSHTNYEQFKREL